MTETPKTSEKLALPPGVASIDNLVAESAIRQSFRFFEQSHRLIDEQHLAICRIPAPTFHERARAEWFLDQFTMLGLAARIDRAGNVLATPSNIARNAPLVAVSAHLDTVLAPSSPEQIETRHGKFQGPGVSDNGAGLAALMAVATAYASQPFLDGPAHPLFVANVGEEGEGNLSGMRFLCRPSPLMARIRAFVVLDGPSIEHVTSEALACRRFDLAVSGPGGHSWADHGTANPIHALAKLITTFVETRAGRQNTVRCSFNFGVIDGGSTVNAIPSAARAKADLRSADPPTLDGMVEDLTAAGDEAVAHENAQSSAGRVTLSIRETGSRPGGRLEEEARILDYIHAVDRHLGIRSWPDCASTDANIPLSLGVEAISIGAGGSGGGAHTPAEWYSSEGRALGLRRIVLLLSLLLADAAGR
ncbi:MAG TPA: M20/M25/M40 family metallo-hydrolase [Bryobacteraceae bacterium]|nr:M20/M25/M40 family metallo-hydrolase [Bryobacteraceae bacterium]